MIKSKHTQVYSKAPVDEHIVRRTLKRVQDITYGQLISRQILDSLQVLRSQFLAEVDTITTCLSLPSRNIVFPQSVNTWLIRRAVEDVLFVIDVYISKCCDVLERRKQFISPNTINFLPTPQDKSARDYEVAEVEAEVEAARDTLLHEIYDKYFKIRRYNTI